METSSKSEFPAKLLNIAAYNIRGLKSKNENNDFIQYLRAFDIFILIETHTLPNAEAAEIFKVHQPDFECLHWKDAERVFRFGRGIGGCIIGIRRSLLDIGISHSVVEVDEFKVLQLDVGNKNLQIVPLYIRSADWDKEFKPVTKTFQSTKAPMKYAIVMGDVNIRLGELKQEVEQFTCVVNTNGRRSLDKERNEKGKKFLDFCDSQNLTILNGLTHGDPEGTFTCYGGRSNGRSTNDICAVSRNLMALVVDFKVDSVRHGSDHLPICLQLNLQFDVLTDPPVARIEPIRKNSHSLTSLDLTYESLLDSVVSVDEVLSVLNRVPLPGFSKNALKDIIGEVTLRCNDILNCLNMNSVPNSNIVSSNNLTKILLHIVRKRLVNWCMHKNILSDYQTQFSKKASKVDSVYNLSSIVNIQMTEKGRKVYAFFVHFESISSEAFIKLLWNKLNRLGVSSKIIRILKSVYKQAYYREQLLNYFQNRKGILSNLIYTLYFNDLPQKLEGGLSIDERQINILMYAAKIVLLSDTVSGLQEMINRLEEYCLSWGIKVDLELSEVMVFKRGGRKSGVEKWLFTGKEIKTTSLTIYLNFLLTPTFSYTKQVQRMIAEAKPRLEDFRSESDWTELMNRYMAPLWGSLKKSYRNEFGKLQKSLLINSHNNSTNLNSLALDLHLKYIGNIYFSHADNSIVRFLTLKVIEKNIMWAENLDDLCRPIKLQWKKNLGSERDWAMFCSALISRLEAP